MLLNYLVDSARPKKILEIGCANGVLSHHVGTILGALNNDSLLYCITNTIGNGTEDKWIEAITRINEEDMPRVAFAAVDYNQTCLMDKSFDVVIFNLSENIESPKSVIEEGIRLVKEEGKIMCLCNNQQWLFYDIFCALVGQFDEYNLHESGFILMG